MPRDDHPGRAARLYDRGMGMTKERKEIRQTCGRCKGGGLIRVDRQYKTKDKNGKTIITTKKDSQLCNSCGGVGYHKRYV